MTIIGIDTVAIVVSDRRKAIQWYRDIMGLQVAYVGPPEPNPDPIIQGSSDNPGHWIEMGPSPPQARVHICQLADNRTELGPTGITFLTDDIHSDFSRLTSKGVRFLYPPRKMEWGEWLCEFVDPDGNEFDLKQPLSTAEWKNT